VTVQAAAFLRRLDLAEAGRDPAVAAELGQLVRRGAVPREDVRAAARAILADVRLRGAAGVRDAASRFGGGRPDGRLLLTRDELGQAAGELPDGIRAAARTAIANVERFARTQLPGSTRTTILPGVEIERRWVPVRRVGAYVPGGSAPYPSSLIMTVVPARVAGVDEVVVATPAAAGGTVDAVVLGIAGLLEVDAVLVAGGAQAVGALAYGLPDLDPAFERVDLVVGPGNAFVTAAKLEIAGEVAIDLPAGPSEGLVLADETANPRFVAADLLTQAEHGPDSPAILVTTDRAFADRVEREVASRLAVAHRRAILARGLAEHGRIVIAPDLATAVAFVNEYAAEHVSVDVAPLEETVEAIRSAGSLLVGRWAPESAGDYATGANHVLPTGGMARCCSGLSVETYGRYIQVQRITRDGLAALRPSIATLAEAEGLHAHRDAVTIRFEPTIDEEPPS